MKTRPEADKLVQEALDSLDGIQRAEPQPFFYTRLMGRLQRDQKTIWETMGSFLSRPAVAFAGLFLILMMNVFIVSKRDTDTNPALQTIVEQSTSPVPDNDYVIAASSSFEYENIDQQ
jgi:hypothetical protein